MLVPMEKVEIIGPKNLFLDVVTLLHDQGRLHVDGIAQEHEAVPVPVRSMELEPERARLHATLSDMLTRLRAVIGAMETWGAKSDVAATRALYEEIWGRCVRCGKNELHGDDACGLRREVFRMLESVEGHTAGLMERIAGLQGEAALLARYEPVLAKIQPLARDIVTTGAFDAIALRLDRRFREALPQLKAELDTITHHQCELISSQLDDESIAAIIVFSKTYTEPVHAFLATEDVNQIRLPDEMRDVPFDEAYERLRERLAKLPAEISDVQGEIARVAAASYARLVALRDVVVDRIAELDEVAEFGQTEWAFVISGWIPESDLPGLMRDFRLRFDTRVLVSRMEMTPEERAKTPVALQNAPLVAPYQALLGLSGAPQYGSIDPTFLVAFFYPLFFGMIVGDIGYGLIMVGVVLWLRRRFRDVPFIQTSTSILGPAATMVVAFGVLYGELFGNLLGPEHLDVLRSFQVGPWELPFNRVEKADTLLYVALSIGFLQVALGLGIGMFNAARTRNREHLWERAGLLVVLFAFPMLVALLAFAGTTFGPWTNPVAAALGTVLLVGLFMAFKGGKVLGLVESVSQFANVFSYMRIMAVGMAGAIIADATNQMATSFGLVTGILIGIVMHSLNLLMAAFSPNIHAIRLNFLEFFGKFFEGGGQQYRPFSKTGGERRRS